MKLEKFLLEHKTRTITEKELKEAIGGSYGQLVEKVHQLVENNLLQPVKASKTNGRRPALYNKYRIIRPEKDYTAAVERIKLLHPKFDHEAYFNNPGIFLKYQKEIETLSDFLWRRGEELEAPMSINERSLKIWGREKYLRANSSLLKSVLKFKDWTLDMLNVYDTPEPFFEYIHRKGDEMNVLIVENKDTWYTLRKVMLEKNSSLLLGREYHVLLYGEGRKITRETGRLEEYGREMLAGSKNSYYYFGDLDFEGISIFMDLVKGNRNIGISLCTELYRLMLSESDTIELPESEDNRGKNVDADAFISLFAPEFAGKIVDILGKGRYIPQEVINYQVFNRIVKGKSK